MPSLIGLQQFLLPSVSEKIDEFMGKFAHGFRPVGVDNIYAGPYSDRKLTRAAYAEFASSDSRREVLKLLSDKPFSVDGQKIEIKNARSTLNGQRNYSLRRAVEMLKASPMSTGKAIEIKWQDRSIEVGGVVAFRHEEAEVGGSFQPPN